VYPTKPQQAVKSRINSKIKPQINAEDKPMLKTYEAIIQDGQFKWLDERPNIRSGRVFITVLEDRAAITPSISMAINDLSKQDLLNLFGSEPDAQDISNF